jgi:hypothetical protein
MEIVHALFIHTVFDGIFVVGFGGVVEGAAEAGCGHVCIQFGACGFTAGLGMGYR